MASFNQIQLLGNVGRIDIKTFTGGDRIAECSLATTERYTDRSGAQKEDTQWHRLVIGGKLADIAERYIHKGDPLFVQGAMRYRNYTDRDGNERSVAEVRVTTLQLLAKSDRQQAAPAQTAQPANINDDLPF